MFFSSSLFACRQEVISSFRLFREARSGLQIMKNFPYRHKLQRFEAGLYGEPLPRDLPSDLNIYFPSSPACVSKVRWRANAYGL